MRKLLLIIILLTFLISCSTLKTNKEKDCIEYGGECLRADDIIDWGLGVWSWFLWP